MSNENRNQRRGGQMADALNNAAAAVMETPATVATAEPVNAGPDVAGIAAERDAARAESLAGDALAIARRNARDEAASSDVGLAALLRAEAREALGRRADASLDIALAVKALTNALGADHADTRRAQELAMSWGASAP